MLLVAHSLPGVTSKDPVRLQFDLGGTDIVK